MNLATLLFQIWRIEKFLVKDWPKRKYGKVRGRALATPHGLRKRTPLNLGIFIR